MATEIERKFLVTGGGWREGARCAPCRQGYLCAGQKASVRVRVMGEEAWLTIKEAAQGASRAEFEYAIPVADAHQMLDTLCEGRIIEKTRYWVEHEGKEWEVDVFGGENAPLVIAEIELDDAAEAFVRPPWLGEEVTRDKRYYNASLSRRPYASW
ncbi:MAG: CYTH domain-containing protein [Candidatus Hydrogenedentales bacterium]